MRTDDLEVDIHLGWDSLTPPGSPAVPGPGAARLATAGRIEDETGGIDAGFSGPGSVGSVGAGAAAGGDFSGGPTSAAALTTLITTAGTPHHTERRPPAMLRLPGRGDPAPHGGKLLGMCAWATTIGIAGLAVAGRAFVLILTDSADWWYQPAVVSTGLVGIALAGAAFMAVHRPRLPWLMLAAATAMLTLAIALTSSA